MVEKLTVSRFKKLDIKTIRGIISKAGKGKVLAECRNSYHTATIEKVQTDPDWDKILTDAYAIYTVGNNGYAHIIFDPDEITCISTYPPPNTINKDRSDIRTIEEAAILDKTNKELLNLIPYDGASRPIKILCEKLTIEIGGSLYKYIKFAEIPEGVMN